MSRRPDACMRMDGTALWKPDTRLQRFHYVVHVSLNTTTQEPAASARSNKPEPPRSSIYTFRHQTLCTISQHQTRAKTLALHLHTL